MKNIIATFLEKRKLKKDWRLVYEHSEEWHWVDFATRERNGKTTSVYIYLFENGIGQRKITHKYVGHNNGSADCKLERCDWYNEIAYTWSLGKYNPKIDSYESVKLTELRDKLAYSSDK